MPRTLKFFTYFWKVSVSWSWQALVVSCKHDGFFFREGVWRHGIFVSRQNVKERDTHVSPEILYNSTNPMMTSKLLKCFQISVPYASDVYPKVRGLPRTWLHRFVIWFRKARVNIFGPKVQTLCDWMVLGTCSDLTEDCTWVSKFEKPMS